MIRHRHWAVAFVTSVALHALAFSVLVLKPDQGAGLPGHYGIEVELSMLGEGAQASGEDKEPQAGVAPPAERASKVEPESALEPEPEPEPKPESLPEPVLKTRPVPAPEPKPEPERKPAQTSAEVAGKPIDAGISPANPGTGSGGSSGPEGARSGGGSAGDSAANAGAKAADASKLWQAEVAAHLARHKHYPMRARRMRQEAVVTLSFVVARDGSVRASEITGLSEHAELNRAVEEMLERAEPLPRFPVDLPGQEVRMTIPVEFKLR
ncbi:energy transducer TonB [Marinobacter sediminicola]|uniref:energy transducer TonB n=1 Tax=Marinobacter sediminicola TaxID=3072994 RepID=UPI002812338C|nr:energy transducer TonB [Marinobacter sp. F26243]